MKVLPFTVHDVEQRSEEWRQLRAGKLTASAAGDMMTFRKDKTEAAGRRDLRTQLVLEIITGQPQEDAFLGRDMTRGIELEAAATAAYELATDTTVRQVGFITHNVLPAGYSPDGVIGDLTKPGKFGLLELKCPRAANHLAYYLGKKLPSDWEWQCRHALWITGAPWIDFGSYCAQFPEGMRLFRAPRLYAKDVDLHAYEINLRSFLAEVDAEVAKVRKVLQEVA